MLLDRRGRRPAGRRPSAGRPCGRPRLARPGWRRSRPAGSRAAGCLADLDPPWRRGAHGREWPVGTSRSWTMTSASCRLAQGLEGQQVGIAGAGADQRHRAGRLVGRRRSRPQTASNAAPDRAAEETVGERADEEPLPEVTAARRHRRRGRHRVAPAGGEPGQGAETGRQQRLDHAPDAAGRGRGRALGADGDDHRVAVDDRRGDGGGEVRPVDDIERNAERPRGRSDACRLDLARPGQRWPAARRRDRGLGRRAAPGAVFRPWPERSISAQGRRRNHVNRADVFSNSRSFCAACSPPPTTSTFC